MTEFLEKARIESFGITGKAVFIKNNEKYNFFPERQYNAFVYFLSGEIDFIYDDVSFYAEENTFVFLPQGKKYKTLPRQRGDFLIINFYTDFMPEENAFAFKPADAKSFMHEMNSAAKSYKYREAGFLLEIRSRVFALAALIEKEFSEKSKKGFEAIIKLIDSDPNITVADLAKSTNVSTRYFTKKFEKVFKISPKQYIIEKKLTKACDMLIEKPDTPLCEIAERCGFCDVYYFSRLFKKHMGMTPTQYKNSFI